MLYLLLSVLSSVVLGFLFKLFPKYGVHTFQAIIVNYFVCVLCGWVALGDFPVHAGILEENWFPYAVVLGLLFVTTFNFAAITFQRFGMTVGAVMQKMSIVISVTYFIIVFSESTAILKIGGIILALVAILLTNLRGKTSSNIVLQTPTRYLIYPILTLLLSGVIEILLFKVEQISATPANVRFISTLFGMAALSGFVIMLPALVSKKMIWNPHNITAGILLGVPNFFSIYFLLKAVGIGWEGSVVFPVNNVATIAVSTLVAIWIFKESLTKLNWLGVLFALTSIILIMLGN